MSYKYLYVAPIPEPPHKCVLPDPRKEQIGTVVQCNECKTLFELTSSGTLKYWHNMFVDEVRRFNREMKKLNRRNKKNA